MFSARTGFARRPNRLTRALAARRDRGQPVIDLTVSNPTAAGLRAPSGLLDALAGPEAASYAPEPRGLRRAREAVCEDGRRRGLALDPDGIVLTASTSEAYSFLFKLLCEPGQEVLVPRPGYPLFEHLAGLESVQAAPYALAYDGRWHLSVDALAEAIGPASRALVVVSPNNPTGSFLERVEADRVLGLCAERGLAVIADEVFADYAFRPDDDRVGSLAAGGPPTLVFSLGGLSKSCGLPQLKLGWMAVAGPESLRAEALRRLEFVADTFLSVNTPAQAAAPAILARKDELQAPIRERLARNLAALAAAFAGSAATLLDVEGGWYAVLRVPATRSEEDLVVDLVEEDGVLVHPGYFFDFPGEAYLVLSLLPAAAEFRGGVEKLRTRLGR
jgi:hypothetical protein